MPDNNQSPDYSYKPALIVAAVWTALLAFSAVVNYRSHVEGAVDHARYMAEAYIEKDLAVRRWITGHGGVYVRPSESTPPNPWLNMPKRDVRTTDGMELTLVNPAYATRQLHEEFAAQNGVRGHLTALQLKNPNNAPDDWERATLKRLAAGEKFVAETVDLPTGKVFRLMRPVFMEQGCMKCHSDMNIPLGGLRGGISTSVQLTPFLNNESAAIQGVLVTHGTIWLVGLFGIGWMTRRNRGRFVDKLKVSSLLRKEERLVAEMMSLGDRLGGLSEHDLIQEGLAVAQLLTGSPIAYFHFVNEDQNSVELGAWSRSTLEHYCKAFKEGHYPLDKAGIWADCARLHRPVVHNDYASEVSRRGLPEGHAELVRHLSVPVMEGGLVRVIAGVGNKAELYDADDQHLLQLLIDDLWKLVQRKRAEAALQSSEQRLREAQRLARLGSWELDHASGKCDWSEEMYAVFGVDRSDFVPSYASMLEQIHPDDRAAGEAVFRQASIGGASFERVLRVLTGSGQLRLVYFRALTELDEAGAPLVSRGTAQDVTEQRELERLRQSKADLTSLFENTDRLIWMVDAQCRLVIANSVFHDTMRQAIGRRLNAGDPLPAPEWPAAELDVWRTLYRRGLAGEQFAQEIAVAGLGNEARWINFSVFPIVDDDTGVVSGLTITGYDFTQRRQLDEAQRQLLEQKELVLRELEAHHRQSLLINRLNDLLQSCRAEREAYEVISLALGEIFAGHVGCLAIAEAHSRDLLTVAAWGETSAGTSPAFTIDDCWALRRGEVHVVQAGGELPCQHFDQIPAHGYICLPLVVGGETLGLLNLELPAACDSKRMALIDDAMRRVAETIKLSLSNLRLRIALEEQATHDTLTGLFNRRYLDNTLPRELHRARRNNESLTVAMIDIDHFKNFNDKYGHEAGDLVLHQVGQLLRHNLRKSDVGCRYGGEELLVVLPNAGALNAQSRLAEFCAQIRTLSIVYRDQILPPVTVSVGIASAGDGNFDSLALLRAADTALYAAKAAGRDRIAIFGETMEEPAA